MSSRMVRVSVPEGYRCPLCPDHIDPGFSRHPLIPVPLCDACLIELGHYALKRYPDLRGDWQKEALVLEELTGRSWRELRTEIIKEQLDFWAARQQEKRGRWIDAMLRPGWSRERCEAFVDEQVAHLRSALDDAEIEGEVHRLIG